MPVYTELEGIVVRFIVVRNTLLIPHDAAQKSMGGLQDLVREKLASDEYGEYMEEVNRFLKHSRVSSFMKGHLSHRFGSEFTTGWYDREELLRENGILLNELGIDMQRRGNRGRFKFFSIVYGPEVERAYFLKYGEQMETYNRLGIPQGVDLNLWAKHLTLL